jgi:signal transduction histidine kinase
MVRALLIDDNPTDRAMARRELTRVFPGFRATEVGDPAELEQALAAGDFDLVVTDYQLRWSDGLAVLHAVKGRYPDRPVVMFTGSGSEEVAVEAMKAGLDDYVVKSPRHAIRLVTAVRLALDKAEARRRAAAAERERDESLARERAARAEAERLLAEAREADRRKDEFLAVLAHELRNPLAPIRNSLGILQLSDPAAPSARTAREMIARQVAHLSRLVDDLLDVSRISRGRVELRREPVDLARLARTAAEDHRGLLERNGLTLAAEVPAEPVWADGAPTRLAQVVGNLLHNAGKFTPAGGRVAVRVRADRTAQRAVLEVEDTGIGIDPGLLPRVFDMFTQADRSLDRSQGGLGLGLALVRGLAELHGGGSEAVSPGPGLGATFTVWVPLAGGPPAGGGGAAAPPTAATATRVLVVEDHPDVADSLRLLLELSGHEVRVARTGPDGVTAAREFRPAVVLCDLGLPGGMNGYDVARAVRADPQLAGVRLAAVSGYGQPEDQARARAAGFDHHLTKPVDPADLLRLLGPAGG